MQKIIRYWAPLLLLPALLLAAGKGFGQDQGKIYRFVDENGTVVFSDQAPWPGADPIVLQEANVVTTVKANPRPIRRPSQDDEGSGMSMSFVSPKPDETFWGTGNDLPVLLSISPSMRQGLLVRLYIDGELATAIGSTQTTIRQIDRGTHDIRAELVDPASERVLASAGPTTFHMKQFSRDFDVLDNPNSNRSFESREQQRRNRNLNRNLNINRNLNLNNNRNRSGDGN